MSGEDPPPAVSPPLAQADLDGMAAAADALLQQTDEQLLEQLTSSKTTSNDKILITGILVSKLKLGKGATRGKYPKLQEFSGKKNSMDIAFWLLQVFAQFALYPWISPSEMVSLAVTALGPAYRWWSTVGESLYNNGLLHRNAGETEWNVFCNVLKSMYLDKHAVDKARNTVANLHQGRKDVSRLAEIFREHLALIPEKFSDATLKFWFRKGLNSEILNGIPGGDWDTKSLEEMISVAVQVEKNRMFNAGAFTGGRPTRQQAPPDTASDMDLGMRGQFGGRGRGRGSGFPGRMQGRGRPPTGPNPATTGRDAAGRFVCHECQSPFHFVRNCPVRRQKLRDAENGRREKGKFAAMDSGADRSEPGPSYSSEN